MQRKSLFRLTLILLFASLTLETSPMPWYQQWSLEHKAARMLTRKVQVEGWLLAELEKRVDEFFDTQEHTALLFNSSHCWDLAMLKKGNEAEQLTHLITAYNSATEITEQKKCAQSLLTFISKHKLKEPRYWYTLREKALSQTLTPYFSWSYLLPRIMVAAGLIAGCWYGLGYLKYWLKNKPKNDPVADPKIPISVPPEENKDQIITTHVSDSDQDNASDNENNNNKVDMVNPNVLASNDPAVPANGGNRLVVCDLSPQEMSITKWNSTVLPSEFTVYVVPAANPNLSPDEKNNYYHNIQNNTVVSFKDGSIVRRNGHVAVPSGRIAVLYRYTFYKNFPWVGPKLFAADTTWMEFEVPLDQPLPAITFTQWDTENPNNPKPCLMLPGLQPLAYGSAGYIDEYGHDCSKPFYSAFLKALKGF